MILSVQSEGLQLALEGFLEGSEQIQLCLGKSLCYDHRFLCVFFYFTILNIFENLKNRVIFINFSLANVSCRCFKAYFQACSRGVIFFPWNSLCTKKSAGNHKDSQFEEVDSGCKILLFICIYK